MIQTTATERRIADQPVMIPDDLLIQSLSEQNDTVVHVANNHTQEPLSSSSVSTATVEVTKAAYSDFLMNGTTKTELIETNTTQEPSVERENDDRSLATNTTGALRWLLTVLNQLLISFR